MDKISQAVESYSGELITDVRKLVQLNSVKGEPKPGMPFGENIDLCYRKALRICESLGFTVTDFDGYAGHAEIGEGDEVIGILGHLDTVPLGDGWDYPPTGAVIEDGRIIGRGVMDDKGPTLAAMYAVKALQKAQIPLTKRIRVIFGLDEESGWECMDYYLKRVKEPDISFTPDGAFPVIYGEKGIWSFDLTGEYEGKNKAGVNVLSIKGGNRSNVVPDKCEIKLDAGFDIKPIIDGRIKQGDKLEMERTDDGYTVRAFGVSAHGSTPQKGINAITMAFRFLSELPLNPELRGVINVYLNYIGCDHYGEALGCALENEISGKLTVNTGVVRYDGKNLTFTLNIRYPIQYQMETPMGMIKKSLKDTGLIIVTKSSQTPLYIDPQSKLVKKLMKAYIDVTGDTDHPPITISGGTYARAVKNAVAFGPILPGHVEVGHQKNEWASIADLIECSKIYAHGIYELMKD